MLNRAVTVDNLEARRLENEKYFLQLDVKIFKIIFAYLEYHSFYNFYGFYNKLEHFILKFEHGFMTFYFSEVGQQQAAMFFRSEPNWELAEPLRDLGKISLFFLSVEVLLNALQQE